MPVSCAFFLVFSIAFLFCRWVSSNAAWTWSEVTPNAWTIRWTRWGVAARLPFIKFDRCAEGDRTSQLAGGQGVGRMVILSRFPSAEAWGAASPKIQGDAELQRIAPQMIALGAKLVSVSLTADVTP